MTEKPGPQEPPRVMFGFITPPLLVTVLIVAVINMFVELTRDGAMLTGLVVFVPLFLLNLKLQPLLIQRYQNRKDGQ